MTDMSRTVENIQQCFNKYETEKMDRRERGRGRSNSQKSSSIRLPVILSTESAVEKRLRRLGINSTWGQDDSSSIDHSSCQAPKPSNDTHDQNIDRQTIESNLSNLSAVGASGLQRSQLDDSEETKHSTDSSEGENQSPHPGKMDEDQSSSVEELTDSDVFCTSPLVEGHSASKEIHQSTPDCTRNCPESDAKRGYFEIHLEEMFGNIIGIGGKTVSVDSHQRRRQDPNQLYYSDGDRTVLELFFQGSSRLGCADPNRRHRPISKKLYADHSSASQLVADQASNIRHALSKEVSLYSSLTKDNLRPSMNAGKLVRFAQPNGDDEKFWDNRVHALEQLTSQKMAKNSRQSRAIQGIRTHNNMHLTPLKGSKSRSELHQKKTQVEEDSYTTKKTRNEKNQLGDQLWSDNDDQRHYQWFAAMGSSAEEQNQMRTGRHATQRGLIDYKQRNADWKLANLIGVNKDLETLLHKVRQYLHAFFLLKSMGELVH